MDLSSYINFLQNERPHELMIIEDLVDPDFEITAWHELTKNDSPVLFFKKIKNSQFPLITNLFGTRERISTALKIPLSEFKSYWMSRLNKLYKAKLVENGPVQEVTLIGKDINLAQFPIPHHFVEDVGKYITAGLIVAKHPETGKRNTSFHRLQLKAPDKLGTSLHSRGHLWEYFQKAKELGLPALEIAIFIGAHPGVTIGASAKNGMKADAYDVIGGILQQPLEIVKCKTVDLEVPANAEIVIEGEIPTNVLEMEGPFSEYTGYVTGPERSTQNIVNVKAVTHRSNAIFQSIIPAKSKEHLLLFDMPKEASLLFDLQKSIPRIKDVYFPFSGSHFHVFLSITESVPGLPNHAALLLLGLYPYAKLVVIVDADIDVMDEDAVWEAVATQIQAGRDVNILHGVFHHRLDPSATVDGVSDKLILDATRPKDWTFRKASLPDSVLDRVKKQLQNKLGL